MNATVNRVRQWTVVACLGIVGLCVSAGTAYGQTPNQTQPGNGGRQSHWPAPPPMTIDVNKHYVAIFDTAKGKIVCDLFAKDAPVTVNNFVFLASQHYYDGTVFHRVIPDFMIQGGDPTATGRGGPGYHIPDEVGPDKPKHRVGSLSMANAGPNTGGSQFFITHVVTNWLDGKHTVFGQVRQGQDVVNAIQKGDTIKSVSIQVEDAGNAGATTQPTTAPATAP